MSVPSSSSHVPLSIFTSSIKPKNCLHSEPNSKYVSEYGSAPIVKYLAEAGIGKLGTQVIVGEEFVREIKRRNHDDMRCYPTTSTI